MKPESDIRHKEKGILLSVDTMLSLPLTKWVGGAVALITIGWMAHDYSNRLEVATAKIGVSVDRIADDLAQFRLEIKRDLEARTSDRYTRTDHRMWSYELEKQNSGRITVPGLPAAPQQNGTSETARN